MWAAAEDASGNLQQYYKYDLKYRRENETSWAVSTADHQPDSAGRQQHTLTGLQYDTHYEVKVTSVRTVRDDTEETQGTDRTLFTTKCTGTVPSKEYLLFEIHRFLVLSNAYMCLTHTLLSYFQFLLAVQKLY